MHRRQPLRKCLVPALAGLAGLCLAPESLAAGCDAMIAKTERTGEIPHVVIDLETKSVTIQTLGGSCAESVSKWSKRRLDVPVVPKATAGHLQRVTAEDKPKVRKGPGVSVGMPPAPRRGKQERTCDTELWQVWKRAELGFEGEVYWLSRVFTIDQDRDGTTDDLGFVLKGEEIPDRTLRYFADSGGISAKDVAGLKLRDDMMVGRFCFGSLELDRPMVIQTVEEEDYARPNLAREAEEKKKKKQQKQEPEKEVGVDPLVWLGLAGGAVFMLLVAGVWFFVARREQKTERDFNPSFTDDDEDEEIW